MQWKRSIIIKRDSKVWCNLNQLVKKPVGAANDTTCTITQCHMRSCPAMAFHSKHMRGMAITAITDFDLTHDVEPRMSFRSNQGPRDQFVRYVHAFAVRMAHKVTVPKIGT